MQAVMDAETLGYSFWAQSEKLKYAYTGTGEPPQCAAPLLRAIISNKEQALTFLRKREVDNQAFACDSIERAYRGVLKQAVIIAPLLECREVLGERLWLCPDSDSMNRAQKSFPNILCVTANELFCITSLALENNKAAAIRLVRAKMLFGGEIGLNGSPVNILDSGADLDHEGTKLWLQVLTAASVISKDFYSRLAYVRGTGARLETDERTGFKIVPIIDETGACGWESVEHYNAERWCLQPYVNALSAIFKDVATPAV